MQSNFEKASSGKYLIMAPSSFYKLYRLLKCMFVMSLWLHFFYSVAYGPVGARCKCCSLAEDTEESQ